MKTVVSCLWAGVVCLAFGVTGIAQTAATGQNGTLSGDVTYVDDGAPIRNAYVVIHRHESTGVGVTDTNARVDSKGMFEFSLAPGLYDVMVAASAFAPTCKKIEITSGKSTEFKPRLEADDEHLQH
jgi:hypothetical protein